MKVVVAIDSLKGSMSSMEAGYAIKEGILRAMDAEVVVKPLADGGEGTTEALLEGMGGEMVYVSVTGPFGKPVKAGYGIVKERNLAVIEIAAAAGLVLIKPEERNPLLATTYGVGEMILDAISRGCRDFIIGIGGSATTDGGVGMLMALGFEFLDEKSLPISRGIAGLGKIMSIRAGRVLPELNECNFMVACDVINPLCGKNGAVHVYGAQKGVEESQKELLDEMMLHYAEKTREFMKNDFTIAKGAGAAGGLGYAFLSYLHAELRSGIAIVLEAIGLEEEIQDADFVITGEGQLDLQTAMGKVPVGVAKLAKKYHAKVIALAGSLTKDAPKCNKAGIDAYFSILTSVVTLKEAMRPQIARKNMVATAEQVFRLIAAMN